ncbi:MAG: hypothetical protein WC100_01595 [Sterolibacterium sp.]
MADKKKAWIKSDAKEKIESKIGKDKDQKKKPTTKGMIGKMYGKEKE